MEGPEALVAALEPIGLEELQARASLEQRLERKYIVGRAGLPALVGALAGSHSVLEVDGRRSFEYITDYFDSPGLACYRAHLQHRRRRFKARVREYADSGYRRFEVKVKAARGMTVKHWTDGDADIRRFARETVAREYGLEVGDLEPAMRVRYRRITLVSRDGPERATIDCDLRFEDAAGRRGGLLPGYAIVETKGALRLGAADRALRELGFHPVRMSKYVAGIALLSPRVPNELRPVVRRHFRAAVDGGGTVGRDRAVSRG